MIFFLITTCFSKERIHFNSILINMERIVLDFSKMFTNDVIPSLEEDFGSLSHSPADEGENEGTQSGESQEGTDNTDGSRSDSRAWVSKGDILAAQTGGSVASANTADVIIGTGGRDAVATVAGRRVTAADTAEIHPSGAH